MENHFDYNQLLTALENKGIELYGSSFSFHKQDIPLLRKLICYFVADAGKASQLGINLEKGILLTGPIGCGKTSLMSLLRLLPQPANRFVIKSCRDVSFEFIQDGYEVIQRYSNRSFQNHEPRTYCFDDLGTENNLKFYGNECNVMAEILLSRYDLFISRKLITHVTTNLSASEIEATYGNRVRSRMRSMFNLISFDKTTKDKRI
jgi:hypothetical protein